MDIITQSKVCTKCRGNKPLIEFYKKKDSNDGYTSQCKSCLRARRKAYYYANRAHCIEYSQQYYLKNRDYVRQYKHHHHIQNRAKKQLYDRNYHITNKQHHNEQSSTWRKDHPELVNLYKHRHRARQKALPDTLTLAQWQNALDYFNGCCAVCGRPLKDLFNTHTLSADHWIPLNSPSCPGTIAANVVPLCHGQDGCNNSKQDKIPEMWLIQRFGNRKAKSIIHRIQSYFDTIKNQT